MTILSGAEQETIINFNKEEKIAYILTYDKSWQKHLEKKLGLTPVKDNGFGGKEYVIDKKRIKMPRAVGHVSDKQRKRLSDNLSKARLSKKSHNTDSDSDV